MDERRIRTKIKELENYLSEMPDLQAESIDDFQASLKNRRALERELQIMIECVLDICYLIASELALGPPSDDEHVLDLLSNELTTIETIRAMKGFRNILVHKYGIVDDNRVYKFASENCSDFNDFIQDVYNVIERHNINTGNDNSLDV